MCERLNQVYVHVDCFCVFYFDIDQKPQVSDLFFCDLVVHNYDTLAARIDLLWWKIIICVVVDS